MSNNEENGVIEYVKQMSLIASIIVMAAITLNILVAFFSSFGAPAQIAVDDDAINQRLQAIEVVVVKGAADSNKAKDIVVSVIGEETKTMAVEGSSPDAAAIDGKAIVATTCFACHGTGILESPKTGDKEAWTKRLEANVDIDGLVKSAIIGKGAMPPKGGNAGLSDAELKAAIEFMMQ